MDILKIVPEPSIFHIEKDKKYPFDGFSNFPLFLREEFNIPYGRWKIEKIERGGNGISIEDGVVRIWGDEYVGYATIIQIIKQTERYIPALKLEEKFNFSFRGYHLDIARGGVPTLKTFKGILRWLFLLKYNYFGIYFEDLFPWKYDPQIGKGRGRLTGEELDEIIGYGKKLGIEVFPSLELTGHMEHILTLPKYREYSEWHRPWEGCLDLSNSRAREFAINLLEEVCEYFPSHYIHIGGDETWALGRGKSLNKRWIFRGDELYKEHYKDMINVVSEYNKKPIMWGDMLTGVYLTPDERKRWSHVLEDNLWDRVTIANWDYTKGDKSHFLKIIDSFGETRKLNQIVAPGLSDWNTFYPNFETALINIKNFLDVAKEEGIRGFLLTSWGDDGKESLFSFLDPLILATMEIAEGNSKWEEKWKILADENDEVLRARKLFGGSPIATPLLKRALFGNTKSFNISYTLPISPLSEKEREEYKEKVENVLSNIGDSPLPSDLDFIKRLGEVSLLNIKNRAKKEDFIELSERYAKLWLEERKAEGLERAIERFWGLAGMVDIFG